MQSPDLVSLPSQNVWKPYNDAAEQTIVGDFKRLWATNFLDDLSIETARLSLLERRASARSSSTTWKSGSASRTRSTTKAPRKSSRRKVEERLRELGITIRLDSFVDQATEKRVANVIREMMVEKGFQDAKVEPVHEPLPGGPKTVALKFKVTEGPKVKISNVDFVGNKVYSDGKLRGRMKTNKGGGFWIFPGSSVYQEDKFEEDAQMVVDFYRERGYCRPTSASRTLKQLRDSKDGKTRFMTLEIPVTEGARYRIDKFDVRGQRQGAGARSCARSSR